MNAAVLARIETIAAEVGRLRRHAEPGSPVSWLAERLADEVEALDAMLYPSAAEFRVSFLAVSGDDELSTVEALRVADARAGCLRRLLGRERA